MKLRIKASYRHKKSGGRYEMQGLVMYKGDLLPEGTFLVTYIDDNMIGYARTVEEFEQAFEGPIGEQTP